MAAAVEVDPVERRGRQQCLQADLGRLGKALSKKLARLALTRGIGQGRGNTADEARILFTDADLDAHEALTLLARAVNCDRRFCFAGHGHFPISGNPTGNRGPTQPAEMRL